MERTNKQAATIIGAWTLAFVAFGTWTLSTPDAPVSAPSSTTGEAPSIIEDEANSPIIPPATTIESPVISDQPSTPLPVTPETPVESTTGPQDTQKSDGQPLVEIRDSGYPLTEYGDGCVSYDDSPNWVVCPTEAYSADLRVTLTICEQEDSRNCYWDAKRMGNGLGTSFINIEGIIYTPSDRSE